MKYFINELAHEAGQDPLAFRRAMLMDKLRYLAVLDMAAAKAGWGTPLPGGQAFGVALHESFGAIVAQQMEGAVVFGLLAALYGDIDIHEGVVQQKNFPQYERVKLAQAPVVQTYVVPSSAAPPVWVSRVCRL